jgi:hypothetical protein
MKKLFAVLLVLALVVSPALASTSDDMRDPISWLLSLGKSGGGKGPQGEPGPMGPQGTVLYINCGENQCIMNQTPNMTAGPPGPTGPQGLNGTQGIPGEPADIFVNSTITVEAGENAYVVDSDPDPGLASLDFEIPRGYNGTAGSPGAPGTAATINVNYTFTGASGTSALVTNIGTQYAALLDFTIPQGPQGSAGVNANLGGANTQVIFNNNSVADGDSCMTFNDATGSFNACYLSGDGSALTGIGQTAATSLTFDAKACSAGTIYEGQAVYISGASGSNPIVCQADNTNTAKSRVVGLMVADTNANSQGKVRRSGTLPAVDTRSSNANINPLAQTWTAGDLLFATTGGGLTNVRPTSGRSVKAAYTLEGSSNGDVLLAYPMENPVWTTAASNEDIVLRVGDSAGTNKVSIRNYANTEKAYINSYGTGSFNGSDMQSKKITSVADPTSDQDAATKKYVDDNAGGGPSTPSWDTYTISFQGLTSSPADSVSNYFGSQPVATSTTANIRKMVIPTAGNITAAEVYDYSGTAGTGEAVSYYVVLNGGLPGTLVQTQSLATNERTFSNRALSIPVSPGDYIEMRRLNPAWATNPLTNIVGGYVLVNTTVPTAPNMAGYTLTVQALTSSPTDGQTVYFGNMPKAPVTSAAISKVYIPKAGYIKRADLYCYSGTAGTGETWSTYIRVNNANDYLIQTLTVAGSERRFNNGALNISVSAGDYIEIKGVQPTWATNPATTIYGGYIYVE